MVKIERTFIIMAMLALLRGPMSLIEGMEGEWQRGKIRSVTALTLMCKSMVHMSALVSLHESLNTALSI